MTLARRLSATLALAAAALGCSPAAPQRDARGAPAKIEVGGEAMRVELPRAGVREVIAEVRLTPPAPDRGVTLAFYAEDGDTPIATPTLYPPDKPANFLIRVPADARWLRVEAAALAERGTAGTGQPEPSRLVVTLRAAE